MEKRSLDHKGIKLTYYYAAGGDDTIVMMHGYSFNSMVWDRIGLVSALGDMDLSVVAVDVPGFPHSVNRLAMGENDLVSFLDALSSSVKGKLFILGSSASCHAALKFAEAAGGRLSGIIIVAPVSLKSISMNRIRAKVLAVWGSEDDVAPAYLNEDAIKSINGIVAIIKGAGHACYIGRPKEFIKILSEFIDSARE